MNPRLLNPVHGGRDAGPEAVRGWGGGEGLLFWLFLLQLTSCSWPTGEFPTLQNKMRAILRIEVEAVRFLKEEPHRLDSLLQRVRGMTDTLTMLRR